MIVKITAPTHVYAMPGMVEVSKAEAARLCNLGCAEPVVSDAKAEAASEPAEKAESKKITRKKAVK